MKFEALRVTQNIKFRLSFRSRVTNQFLTSSESNEPVEIEETMEFEQHSFVEGIKFDNIILDNLKNNY